MSWIQFILPMGSSRKPRKLPQVLSEEEAMRLFEVTSNLKHRTILMAVYSAGLRLSEVINLRKTDILPESGEVFVRGGKGKKGCYVQHLLGHNSSKTTEIYTHITEHRRRKLRSPLGFLGGEEKSGGNIVPNQEKAYFGGGVDIGNIYGTCASCANFVNQSSINSQSPLNSKYFLGTSAKEEYFLLTLNRKVLLKLKFTEMKNTNLYNILWIAIFSIGILLLLFMITYEDEPGAMPLILIIIGASGYFIRRLQQTRKIEQNK